MYRVRVEIAGSGVEIARPFSNFETFGGPVSK